MRVSSHELTATERRLDGIDRLRGLAVLLMVLDHVVIAGVSVGAWSYSAWWPAWLIRMGPTRAAMPIFMVLVGLFIARRPARTTRVWQVIAAGLLVSACIAASGGWMPLPEILLLASPILAASSYVRRWPTALAAIGVVQVFTWPIGTPYEPGAVLALVCVGVLTARSTRRSRLDTVCSASLPAVLGPVGRRPLMWYVSHLAAVSLAVALSS